MTKLPYSERLKIQRLFETFDDNFRVTRLYASYLESFPEIITKEMIDTLCGDGRISKRDAIAALLAEIFALDTDNNELDKRLWRGYITPSIRILDAKKYRDNPYYKNVTLPDVISGSWEIRNEKYAPYRAVICHDMILGEDFSEIPPIGFFEEEFEFPAVLEDGNEWMTLTPVDLDTCEDAIAAAHGKVVTFGLGLGYYAYMVSEKESVDSITVIEKSPKVIELFRSYILPKFTHPEKVRVICADAFEYAKRDMPCEHYDYAFVDTWRDASDGAPMYRKMKMLEHLSDGTVFSYWIENFLISNLRAHKLVELKDAYEKGELDTGYDGIKQRITDINELIKD